MRNRSKSRIIMAVLTLCWTAACAAHESARDVSRELLAQTMEYENQLVELSRSTQRHGSQIREWARSNVEGTQRLNLESSVTASAENTVEQISRVGVTGQTIRDFVASYLSRTRETALLIRAKLDEIDARAQKTVTRLKQEIKPLASVRTKLEKLQQGPSVSDQVAVLRPVLDAFKKHLNNPNEGAE